ncbi:nuclear transport factor 2 family protein [Bizionia argentinensis JUB59]|uniref:Nuclear transport factor 2 family protein n=1 Tax=Bizionia argentinensis JUB59 TaxID=1046627 RepID=G2EAI4_9FLAO|nr:nuclear transport factor 2 family protein [Bizionia argentinensis]EGV44592.1 nuclear transport factor 2 family protein [Bizionia argentinensis JUB59]
MKSLYLILSLLFSVGISAQSEISKTSEADSKAIRQVLETQEKDWNNFDLEGYMQGYWQSDSLKFHGSSGITKGWQKTLDNYKKGYPNQEYTGELNFTIKSISTIESNSYYVMGQYHLKRSVGDAKGEFLIILKKIDGKWKIIADMSS